MDTAPRIDLLLNKERLDRNQRQVIMAGSRSKHQKKAMINAVNKQHSLLTTGFNGGFSGGGSNRARSKRK